MTYSEGVSSGQERTRRSVSSPALETNGAVVGAEIDLGHLAQGRDADEGPPTGHRTGANVRPAADEPALTVQDFRHKRTSSAWSSTPPSSNCGRCPPKHANLNVLGHYSFRASTPAGRWPARSSTADTDEEE
jgi:hypothetical protein